MFNDAQVIAMIVEDEDVVPDAWYCVSGQMGEVLVAQDSAEDPIVEMRMADKMSLVHFGGIVWCEFVTVPRILWK